MSTAQFFFLPAEPGQRYCIFHPPQGRLRGQVVVVHAFAEELNKTRRMAALQARALARDGFAVLQVDLYGCGDSSGDFSDARWDIWVRDLLGARRWLQAQMPAGDPPPLWLWGLRAGCLLAVDVARAVVEPCNLLLWQPSFLSGSQQLQQFLRLRLAADLLGNEGAKGAMQALKQHLTEGHPLEIAGYTLAPALATGLSHSTLENAPAPVGGPAHLIWMELSNAPRLANQVSPAATRALQVWRQSGWTVQAQTVQGPAFWQSVEIEEAPALLVATQAALVAAVTA